MTVIDKVRDYLKWASASEEHYLELCKKVWINPKFRDQECRKPDLLCENCDLNHFKLMVEYITKIFMKEGKIDDTRCIAKRNDSGDEE